MDELNIMDALIKKANEKFEREETSDEWIATERKERNEREYFRERLVNEMGMVILDEENIRNWFNDVLYDVFKDIYQYYHLDVRYKISDFQTSDTGVYFSVLSSVKKDRSLRVDVISNFFIDDELGENSICKIICKDGFQNIICSAEVNFYNGFGHEDENGVMVTGENSKYDSLELTYLKERLFEYLEEELNPYPEHLEAHILENDGENYWTASCKCRECGETGISINPEEFLPYGTCCYCGHLNELKECVYCHELFSSDESDSELCPVCADHIERL